VCVLATLIAGGSAELARLVGSERARGVEHVIPVSLCILLCHHAHEEQAGRHDIPSPLGVMMHSRVIILTLEALYTISVHFDLRVARIHDGDGLIRFDEAVAEYKDFLHGHVHHMVRSTHAQAYLARVLAFTPRGAPPPDPTPRPIETETEQRRRLMQHADGMQRVRRRVRRQRESGAIEAVRRADAARARGNEAIRSNRLDDALGAYDDAVDALAGFEGDEGAAWPLVLALSNRSEVPDPTSPHEFISYFIMLNYLMMRGRF